jgi:cell wall-associated NlpC family hydrolase/N-acetylmuramoyl-L-alanine amidase
MRLAKRTICALLGALLFLFVFAAVSTPVFATTFNSTSGSTSVGDPIANAIKLSERAFPSGAPAAVVTNAWNWTQAISASVLARAYGGPLLLDGSSASASVVSELTRLQPAAIYVVGLPTSVGTQIAAALAGLAVPPQVVTLTGADARETAVLVARQVKIKLGSIERVVIVPDDDSAGGLVGAALAAGEGWPILLTPKAGPFPQVSTDAIAELGATSGILIGTSVSPSIAGFVVQKTIVGTNSTADPDGRYGVSAQVAEYAVAEGFSSFGRVGVIFGYDRSTAQALAAYVAMGDGVVLLSASDSLPSATAAVMRTHGREMNQIDVVGLGWPVYRQIKSLNSPQINALTPGSGLVTGGNAVVVTGTGLDTTSSIVMGKTTLPTSAWRVDSSTQLTILSTPAVTGSVPVEVIVTNYWGRGPATGKAVYRYVNPGPTMPGDRVVAEAVKYLGVPYVWAGSSPSTGFDCSGFAMYVYKQLGVSLPHKASLQAGYGTPVSKEQLLPGDLVFFSNPISHVGIYVGEGLMINAPRSGDLVTIENAFRSSYATARRILSPYSRFQQDNPLLTYLGYWSDSVTSAASGGSCRYVSSPGSITVSFNGTYLGWITKKSNNYGIASVSLDGGAPVTVDLYSPNTLYQQAVYSTGNITAGAHTLTIEWTGTKNASSSGLYVGVDAFDVLGSLVQAPAPTRYQQDNSNLTYSGTWSTSWTWSASGGSFRYANALGAAVNVKFDGTYLAWIAKTAPNCGKARVSLDGGVPFDIDLYSASSTYKRCVYNTGRLAEGIHTLAIYWSGSKNAASTGYLIDVDTFDVLGDLNLAPAPPVIPMLYQQSNALLTQLGSWGYAAQAPASGGSFHYTTSPGAEVKVSFTGTSVALLAKTAPNYGKALVTLDGGEGEYVDFYSSTASYQQRVYDKQGLDNVAHTLTIDWVDLKNESSSGYVVNVDALEIMGSLTQAPVPTRYQQDNSNLTYSGSWNTSWTWSASGGTFRYANAPGAAVSVEFDGTYLAWITKTAPNYGKARVSLDGGAPIVVDLYSASTVWKQNVWSTGVLAPGTHTVTIQWSWGRNTRATDANVGLDTVDVFGTLTKATATVMHSDPFVVVIDPGHQAVANSQQEPVGPGSATTKDKVSSGTASVNTGSPESALVLAVSLKLRAALQAKGLEVVMTRETQNVDISNSQRAQLANTADGDLFVRIHADGSTTSTVNGILVLYPATIAGWTDDIASPSLRAATLALQELTRATGAKSRGLSARSDLAGFNWSDVPVFLAEIGLMTNPAEDALLATSAYQDKIVSGLTRAILCYLDYY